MIVDNDNDYIFTTGSSLCINDKDGLLCFLKGYLSELPFDELEEAINYIGLDLPEKAYLNMLGFEDLMHIYMCLDEIGSTGEFSIKCEHDKHGLYCTVKGSDICEPFFKWKKIAEFFDGWIQWKDTYDNHDFRYVFMFGTMTEEEPVFMSDSMLDWQKG